MNNQMKGHWNTTYQSREVNILGWYEEKPTPCLRLLTKCDISKDDPILDVGVGASTFIDSLIEKEFTNIIAVDISETALKRLRERLGREKASKVTWIIDDLTEPKHINRLQNIAVWHDRAFLHFLITEDQIQTYFSTLKKTVRRGGYVIIAAFALGGARKCSGLDVKNYDSIMLATRLGEEFKVIESFDYVYTMPSGDQRPYIYTFFQRKQS